MAEWQVQWKRVLRWYYRYRMIDGGLVDALPDPEFYADDVLAFFQSCYHLKDWLKNDPASGVSRAAVEAFVNGSPNLTLCGALATGAKHLAIDDKRFDPNTKMSRRITTFAPTVTVGPPGTVPVEPTTTKFSAVYFFEANGATHDAFALADACVNEWESFLTAKGLPLS